MTDPIDQELPPPAPFMWACTECATLLLDLNHKVATNEGCFMEQLAIARHVVDAHPTEVPAPDTTCARCLGYSARVDPSDRLWAEHRARELFLPQALARLL